MKRKPYPKYKPSGLEWLGDVPENWQVKRLKTSALCWVSNVDKVPAEDELPVRLCNYTDVYYHDHITPDMGLMETTATADEIRRFGLRKGDVLITKDSEEWSDIAVPALVKESAPDLVCGYHLAIIRPFAEELCGDYLLRAFQSCAVNRQFQVAASGVTRYGLPKSSIGDAWLPLPPVPEQRAIAAFLDRETGRIDTLIAKKRELVERLKEKRTALISHTVTHGLPPDAAKKAGLPVNPPLKHSGVAWLGDIPKHWYVKPVKHVARIGNGSTPNRDNPGYWDDGNYPWLNSSVVNQEVVTQAEDFVTPLALRECHLPKISPPAVLIGITGQGRTRGMASTLLIEATINQHVAYLKPHQSRMEVGFLRRVFDMVYLFLRSESDGGGSTKGAITCDQIANLKIPVPPVTEQTAIAAYLDAETSKLDALVAKIEEAVERLLEYRIALITSAVTGKINTQDTIF
jgi:type I restriction enzyme S subunit